MPESKNDMRVGSIHKTKEFGFIQVVEYVNAFKVLVRFPDTGYELWALAGNVRKGELKDKLKPIVYGVGFMGDGVHSSTKKGKANKAYKVWQSMLQRCYDPAFHLRRPTYIGCSVCNDWHNFQIFADWFELNYPRDGMRYQLDKDIIKEGNKFYSPTTCKFVTLKENTEKSSAKTHKFITPNGECISIYNLVEFCKENNLNHNAMRKLGNGRNKSHKNWRRA